MDDIRRELLELQQLVDALSPTDAAKVDAAYNRVRDLAYRSATTPHGPEVALLYQRLSRMLPSGDSSTPGLTGAERQQVEQARLLIETGDIQDASTGVDLLDSVLLRSPDDADALSLLETAWRKFLPVQPKVKQVLEGRTALAQSILARLTAPPRIDSSSFEATYEEAPVKQPIPDPVSNDVEGRLQRAIDQYYAAEYSAAIVQLQSILASSPGNEGAREYLQKAQDALARGVVPESMIPFEARREQGKGNSLRRAGSYEQAKEAYTRAQDLARRKGIDRWEAIEQALLQIEDLAIAKSLRTEGDTLFSADRWEEAAEKYRRALAVDPSDTISQDKLALISKVQEAYDRAFARLGHLSGTTTEQAQRVQALNEAIGSLRESMPRSKKLLEIAEQVQHTLLELRGKLRAQGDVFLQQSRLGLTVDERLRAAAQAAEALGEARALDPAQTDMEDDYAAAQTLQKVLEGVKKEMQDVQHLITQNTDDDISQAREKLKAMMVECAQDPKYRGLVSQLQSRMRDRIDRDLRAGRLSDAATWLELAQGEPFQMLGQQTEMWNLEKRIKEAREQAGRKRGLRTGLQFGLPALAFLLLLFFTRGLWLPIIHPTPTPPPTATDTPTPTAVPVAPMPPSGLVVKAVSNNQIDLAWNDNGEGQVEFEIERSSEDGQSFGLVTTVATGVTTYSDLGLEADTVYLYRVRAVSAGLSSGWSNVNRARTPAQPPEPPPEVPTDVAATAVSDSEISVTWTNNAGPDASFEVQRSSDGRNWILIGSALQGETILVDPNAKPGDTWYYRVRAVVDNLRSEYSAQVDATIAKQDLCKGRAGSQKARLNRYTLRTGPGENYDSFAALNHDDPVVIDQMQLGTDNQCWWHVVFGKGSEIKSGWLPALWISPETVCPPCE
jgi:tetratricopeptide (TPR) repeat protein